MAFNGIPNVTATRILVNFENQQFATVYTLEDLEGVYEMPSPEVSSLFQQLLFSVGIYWRNGDDTPSLLDKPVLYVERGNGGELILTWGMSVPVSGYAILSVDHAIKVVEYLNG